MIVEDNTKLIRPRGQDVAIVKGLCENTKISCEINFLNVFLTLIMDWVMINLLVQFS